jgi:four helix bundle protein
MLSLSYKNPDVYQIAMNPVKGVYRVTASFPKEEQYILLSQIRRAAISVCSNIAEGASRISKPEKKRFYEVYRSSLVEVDTQFEIAIVLNYHKNEQMQQPEQYLESTFRILSKMISNLASNPTRH